MILFFFKKTATFIPKPQSSKKQIGYEEHVELS